MTKRIPLLAIVTMLLPAKVMATHPLVTDDTGTQGKGHYQFEENGYYSFDMQTVDDIEVRSKAVSAGTTLTCGIHDNVDLVAGIPWKWSRIETGGSVTSDVEGIGDLVVQIKWRAIDTGDKGVSLAIRPGITFPIGNEGKGFGNGKATCGMMLIATGRNSTGAIHANIGYIRNRYQLEADRSSFRSSLWHASLAAELNATPSLRPVVNIGMDTNQRNFSGTDPAFLIGGLIYSPGKKLDLDIGIKKGLNDASVATSLLAGVTARF